MLLVSVTAGWGQQPRFRMLAFYSATAEPDHVFFAESALKFFSALAAKDQFTFEATTRWDDMNDARLSHVQVVVWLNESPPHAEQRRAFERYMDGGGAWLGFHAAGYNDQSTNWPWFVNFLGGAVFCINSWPPLPARLVVDDQAHPATQGLPAVYVSPANEWYIWRPSPRQNSDVRVLVSLDPSNYPLGLKDVLTSGELPVVWTNTKYKMVYMNMGHGDKIFTSPVQNQLIEAATLWLGTMGAPAATPEATGVRISPNAVAVNPGTHKVYAVNTRKGIVTVMDGTSHSRSTVKVGAEPEAIAVNPETSRVYVANSGDGTVTVIDGTTDTVIATVNVGSLPYALCANPAANRVYISKTFSNDMTVIDGVTNTGRILKVGVQADAIAMNPVSNKIYLASYETAYVTVIDGVNEKITRVPAPTHLWGIAVNPHTNRVYLADSGGAKVIVMDGVTNAMTSVKVGGTPCAVGVDAAANRIYVVNHTSDTVTVIDGTRNVAIATIDVGAHPQAIAVNSATHTVYVANTHSHNVSVIDGKTNAVTATVGAGKWPFAIAIDTASNTAYVASINGDNLTAIAGSGCGENPAVPSTVDR